MTQSLAGLEFQEVQGKITIVGPTYYIELKEQESHDQINMNSGQTYSSFWDELRAQVPLIGPALTQSWALLRLQISAL